MGRTDFLARYPRARRVFDKARRDVAEYEAAVARDADAGFAVDRCITS